MIAPTGIRSGGSFASGTFSNAGFNTAGNDDLAKVASLSQAIASRTPSQSSADPAALLNAVRGMIPTTTARTCRLRRRRSSRRRKSRRRKTTSSQPGRGR